MISPYHSAILPPFPAPTNQFRWSLRTSRELVLCAFMKRAINKAYAPDCDEEVSIYLLQIGPIINDSIRRCISHRNLSIYQTLKNIEQLALNLFQSTEEHLSNRN